MRKVKMGGLLVVAAAVASILGAQSAAAQDPQLARSWYTWEECQRIVAKSPGWTCVPAPDIPGHFYVNPPR